MHANAPRLGWSPVMSTFLPEARQQDTSIPRPVRRHCLFLAGGFPEAVHLCCGPIINGAAVRIQTVGTRPTFSPRNSRPAPLPLSQILNSPGEQSRFKLGGVNHESV